jgi:hypothetical protein
MSCGRAVAGLTIQPAVLTLCHTVKNLPVTFAAVAAAASVIYRQGGRLAHAVPPVAPILAKRIGDHQLPDEEEA